MDEPPHPCVYVYTCVQACKLACVSARAACALFTSTGSANFSKTVCAPQTKYESPFYEHVQRGHSVK
ncbi:hypothetical protein POVWA2_025930 [Plasmodium ovale wallikeri]|uniref:Uncharacterized protein n=1 Tax=Plasmodium ovale wallikeri TaxID=864142 RepID=A0A1A8YVP7_PLAOA|nr:hypothetical protein POVWA1_026100 [Plasmodium ovale wallikeri]SBT35628.1 hypothetical protein POVWA2_025930 [Plasmodium ovale wallikeri]